MWNIKGDVVAFATTVRGHADTVHLPSAQTVIAAAERCDNQTVQKAEIDQMMSQI